MKDLAYYLDVLGLNEYSTQEDALKAFRTLAKENHPDTSGKDGTMFRLIVEAYDFVKVHHKPLPDTGVTGNAISYAFRISILINRPHITIPIEVDHERPVMTKSDYEFIIVPDAMGIAGFKNYYKIRMPVGSMLPKTFYMPDTEQFITFDVRRRLR